MKIDPFAQLHEEISVVLDRATQYRDSAGRSEDGRLLAVLCTDLERCAAWCHYHGPSSPPEAAS